MRSKVITKGWLEDDIKKLQKELKEVQERLVEELVSEIETKDAILYQETLPLFNAGNPHEEFMNAIIKYGVVNSCEDDSAGSGFSEWFGHEADSDFTWSTIEVLKERLSEQGKEVE